MIPNTKLRITPDGKHVVQIPNIENVNARQCGSEHGNVQRRRRSRAVTRKVEPRIIDFSACERPQPTYRETLNAITPQGRYGTLQGPMSWTSKSGIKYMLDADGKITAKVPNPTPLVERRVRRVLASCKRNPEFAHRPYLFFKNDRVRDVPYAVLKRIYNESEAVSA